MLDEGQRFGLQMLYEGETTARLNRLRPKMLNQILTFRIHDEVSLLGRWVSFDRAAAGAGKVGLRARPSHEGITFDFAQSAAGGCGPFMGRPPVAARWRYRWPRYNAVNGTS